MPKPAPLWEAVAEEAFQWLEEMAEQLAEALAEGGVPFAAKLTEQEKLSYFEGMAYNPDGTPNTVGRAKLAGTYGLAGLQDILMQVNAARQKIVPIIVPPAALTPEGGTPIG